MPFNPPKRSLREAARQGALRNQQERAKQQQSLGVSRNVNEKPQGKPGKPAVVGHEKVKARCGHEEDLELFADNLDKYRARRREKIAERNCKACRALVQVAQQAEAAERRKLKAQRKWDMEGEHGRLPHNSNFNVTFDANAVLWRGTLSIPLENGELKLFTAEHSAVFKLLRALDMQYRRWVEEQKTPVGENRIGG